MTEFTVLQRPPHLCPDITFPDLPIVFGVPSMIIDIKLNLFHVMENVSSYIIISIDKLRIIILSTLITISIESMSWL